MNLTPDDPRLTAYILDELEPDEHKQIAAALARDPELRREAEELRQLAGLAETACAVAVEAAPELCPAHQVRLEDALADLREEAGDVSPAAARRNGAAPRDVDRSTEPTLFFGLLPSRWVAALAAGAALVLAMLVIRQALDSTGTNQVIHVAEQPAPEEVKSVQDKYLMVYDLIREGDQLLAAGNQTEARQKFELAQQQLREIPEDWNPAIVGYRQRYVDSKLGELAENASVLLAKKQDTSTKPGNEEAIVYLAMERVREEERQQAKKQAFGNNDKSPGSSSGGTVAKSMIIVGGEAPPPMPSTKSRRSAGSPTSSSDAGKKISASHLTGDRNRNAARSAQERAVTGQVARIAPASREAARSYKPGSERPMNVEGFSSGAGAWNREGYNPLVDNPWKRVEDEPLLTFSVDVDTASYSNLRRFVRDGQLPPADAVRIEELINYFDYGYAPPTEEDKHPFAVHTEVNAAPWAPEHRLVRIGLKGFEISRDERPDSNFVFLIDVSGSMKQPNKLPLVRDALRLLAGQLGRRDRVAMVVYAGSSGLVLDATPGDNSAAIFRAIDKLEGGGSTNGGAGIQLAYKVAEEHFIEGGANRVILCTDGDFNVGVTSQGALVDLITQKRKSGVFLSVLGFGTGNLRDGTMEQLANKGNGNYAYIDQLGEARKVFLEQMTGTLVAIAKDVKLQVDFNPAKVAGYRLIGYANRLLAPEDFANDAIDAGEIGAGHTVTALYEIVPAGQKLPTVPPPVEPSKHLAVEATAGPPVANSSGSPIINSQALPPTDVADELLTVRLRYKQPEADTSTRFDVPVKDGGAKPGEASADFRFASSLAAFGMLLRDSEYLGSTSWDQTIKLARQGAEITEDKRGNEAERRQEHLQLLEKARGLANRDE